MLKKILGINLLGFGMGACIAMQVGLHLVAGITCLIMGKKDPARSFLISSAALVPIGFFT